MSLNTSYPSVNPRLGTSFGIFTSAFASLVLMLIILEQLGLERNWISQLIITLPVLFYAGIGMMARTASLEDFFISGQRVPPLYNGFALSANLVSGAGLMGLIGSFFFVGYDALPIAGVDGTLRRMLGPTGEREDLLQEVFIRFFRRVGTLREPSAVRGFLTGICLRVVQGEIAGRRRRQWLRLTATGEAPEMAGGARDDEAREAVRRYYRLLDGLPGRDRSIFVTRTIEGLTLEEVAELHGVSVSTAQRRIERATKRIALLARRDPLLASFVEGGPA